MVAMGLLGGLPVLLASVLLTAKAHIQPSLMSLTITRHHHGDLFLSQGSTCYKDLCVGLSSGTAGSVDTAGCGCQCIPNLPVFRDDLNICVDDIQECTLAQFVSGTTTQKIPFVFLPLKGQIVYPSAEITFSEVTNPICVVSGAQFLGRGGWLDLRNTSDTEPPFRLFRDEGRTYLQWLGDGELRSAMEGRLILVHLMCKDTTETQQHRILTPCVAFRVAGNPSVREVIFSTDVRATEEPPTGLTVNEYIAIGVCSVLLGLIYVASIMLYLHIRKRRRNRKREKDNDSAHLNVEEGIVKSNPLLQPRRHHKNGSNGQDNDGFSSDSVSCCSDSDVPSDIEAIDQRHDSSMGNLQISAIVHPCDMERMQKDNQDSFERLPEEDVSIVEEVEGEESGEDSEPVHGMVGGIIRRKLYFNPSYFDPELLKVPPPAAVEFLTKIREVITVAKHKMSAKRFSPSLLGIPEEDPYAKTEKVTGMRSRASSVTSRASIRSTKSTKEGKRTCPGCVEPPISQACCPTDTKQKIIRKWLEDVPTAKNSEVKKEVKTNEKLAKEGQKLIKPEAISKSNENLTRAPEKIASEIKRPSQPPPAPTRAEIKRPSVKGPAPPRPPPPNPPRLVQEHLKTTGNKEEIEESKQDMPMFSNMSILTTFKGKNTPDVPPPIPTSNPGPLPSFANGNTSPVASKTFSIPQPPSPPPMPVFDPDITPRAMGKDKVPPLVQKTLMDAVIKELVVQKKIDPKKHVFGAKIASEISIDKDFDRVDEKKLPEKPTFKTFEYNENDYDNQIDSCIDTCPDDPPPDIPDVVQHNQVLQDDHDYEVILLNPETVPAAEDEKELKIYNLPQILAKSEGYSLVSEVYVNDGYTYSSGQESPNSSSSKENWKLDPESSGRLTIQVKDSPENYKHLDESDFEPDTLDRKPGKLRIVDTITNWEDCAQEKYSNQKFHGLDMDCEHQNRKNQYLSNDDYMDSLERPQIMSKRNGSLRKNSIEQQVDNLLRKLDSPLAKEFSTLREIYEAKNGAQKKRTETTSLVGSVTSDTDCMSTLSWNEDRRNKLLHRGIILHMGSGRKQRKTKPETTNYPDVVPPRPPKPVSLSATPQRSGATTPARSYCPSPTSRSVCVSPTRSACTSPPPRSACTSPPPRSSCTSPPARSVTSTPPPPRSSPPRTCSTPPPPPRTCATPPPPPPPRSTPPASPVPRIPTTVRSKSASPVPPSPAQTTRSRNHSGRASPRRACASPSASPSRSACTSPIPLPPRSTCTSPNPPPKPAKSNNSPPLPPRNLKPPLPPKNAKSTRQKKAGSGTSSANLARRPLPPLPLRSYHDNMSSAGSVSSRDLETLSTLSGASMDSLNSSDYEAFYTLPYDGNDGEIYDKAQEKFLRAQQEVLRNYKNFPLVNTSSDNVFSTDEDIYNAINVSSSFREKVKDLRTRGRRGSHQKWRPMGAFMHKPDDSGYLSTDSNESGLRPRVPSVPKIPERAETPSQGSETEGSADGDGASESGAESTATDSFFFGKVRRDAGGYRHSFRLSDVEVNSDTERHHMPILVRQ